MSARDVVVAIPTFRRVVLLDALLAQLAPQAAKADARMLVIDNDPDASARPVAEKHGVDYVTEPARGLAAVRNRALDEAHAEKALVFIDDDELPEVGWLEALVGRWRSTGADAVSGRVETRFPHGFDDPWIEAGGFFRRVRFPDGSHQPVAATNNLLLDLDSIRVHGLRFDQAFGMSGGEDILLTKQLVDAGGVIVSCPDALVFDVVSSDRLNRRWVLRRAYRVGITTTRTELRTRPGMRSRLRGLAGGLGRVVVGAGRWALGAASRSPRHAARGARATWRGAGMIVGALGGDYREYSKR